MDDQELHGVCLRWVAWRWSRRLYVTPPSKNLLARLQPSRTGEPPDAALDPKMQFVEMAVATLREMPEHAPAMACFWLFYVERVRCIKQVAARLGIGRRTFYDRVRRAARLVLELAAAIERAQPAMRRMAASEEQD